MQRDSLITRRREALLELLKVKAETGFATNGETLQIEGSERVIAVVGGDGNAPPEVQEFEHSYHIKVHVFIPESIKSIGSAWHTTRSGMTTGPIYLDHSGKFWWYEHQERHPIDRLVEMMLKAVDDTAARRSGTSSRGPWPDIDQAKWAVHETFSALSGRFAIMPDDSIMVGGPSVVMVPVFRKNELTYCLKHHTPGPIDDFTGLDLGPQEMMATTFGVIEVDSATRFATAVLANVTPIIEPYFGDQKARITPWMTFQDDLTRKLIASDFSRVLPNPLLDYARVVFNAVSRVFSVKNRTLLKKLEQSLIAGSFRLDGKDAVRIVGQMIDLVSEIRNAFPNVDQKLAAHFGWKLPVEPVSILELRLEGMLEIVRKVELDRRTA